MSFAQDNDASDPDVVSPAKRQHLEYPPAKASETAVPANDSKRRASLSGSTTVNADHSPKSAAKKVSQRPVAERQPEQPFEQRSHHDNGPGDLEAATDRAKRPARTDVRHATSTQTPGATSSTTKPAGAQAAGALDKEQEQAANTQPFLDIFMPRGQLQWQQVLGATCLATYMRLVHAW